MPKNKKKIVPFNLKMLSEVNFLKKKKGFFFSCQSKLKCMQNIFYIVQMV